MVYEGEKKVMIVENQAMRWSRMAFLERTETPRDGGSVGLAIGGRTDKIGPRKFCVKLHSSPVHVTRARLPLCTFLFHIGDSMVHLVHAVR